MNGWGGMGAVMYWLAGKMKGRRGKEEGGGCRKKRAWG